MLRCRQVVEIVGSDMLAAEPIRVRLAVRIHLAMCRHCSAYVRGLMALRRLAISAAREFFVTRDNRKEEIIAAVLREAGTAGH